MGESVHRSLFSLWQIFYSTRLEVLPNLRHAGVIQMGTMVNVAIGFQFIEPLTRPGVKLDEKMSSITIFKIP